MFACLKTKGMHLLLRIKDKVKIDSMENVEDRNYLTDNIFLVGNHLYYEENKVVKEKILSKKDYFI